MWECLNVILILLKNWFENSFRYLVIHEFNIYFICRFFWSFIYRYCLLFSIIVFYSPFQDKNTCLYLRTFLFCLSLFVNDWRTMYMDCQSSKTRFYWKDKKFRYILSRVAKNSKNKGILIRKINPNLVKTVTTTQSITGSIDIQKEAYENEILFQSSFEWSF